MVSVARLEVWCYIGAYRVSEKTRLAAPTYTMQQNTRHSYKLQ